MMKKPGKKQIKINISKLIAKTPTKKLPWVMVKK